MVINGLRIVLDFGMYQGRREEARALNQVVPADVLSADAVILSHGHLDHCGRLPLLMKEGYSAPIYVTPASSAVARIVLEDSAEIQEEDAYYLNKRLRGPEAKKVEPLYRRSDLAAVWKAFRYVRYGIKTDLGNGVSFTFYDAGHILGSAYVVLQWTEQGAEKSLLFTADIGRRNTPIIRDPASVPQAMDYIITESTYGNRQHGPVDAIEPQFLDAVKAVIARGGRLIVPSFAVGRTQTMLWYLQKFVAEGSIPPLPVFVDSPMGTQVSEVYSQHRDSYDEQTAQMIGRGDLFGLSRVTFAVSVEQSKQINRTNGACVVIASSPSCEFGRVLHHLKRSIETPADMVLFVGWIPPYTLGRRLQDGQKRVRIYDRYYEVKMEVRTLHGMSAHADGGELLEFLQPAIGEKTTAFVVHGEADQADAFAQRLIGAGVKQATVPAFSTVTVG